MVKNSLGILYVAQNALAVDWAVTKCATKILLRGGGGLKMEKFHFVDVFLVTLFDDVTKKTS